MTNHPELSVVFTPDDHSASLEKMIDALAAQVAEPGQIEVLLVNAMHLPVCDRSISRIRPEAAARCNLRIFNIARSGRASGWNHGIRQALAPLIWILGDDFIPEPRALTAHLRFHQAHPEEHWVGVGPALFPKALRRHPFRRWLEDSGELFGVSFTRPVPDVVRHYFHGGNTSIKRAFLGRVGLFDEDFRFHTTDDYEFGVRARKCGMQVEHLPEAITIHDHELRLPERQRSMWESGFSNVCLERKHPDLPKPSARYVHSAWGYWALSWKYRLRYLLTGHPEARVRSWQNALLRAQVQGYQAGLAATARIHRPAGVVRRISRILHSNHGFHG